MRLLIFTSLLFCLACEDPKPALSRIDKIAQAFCECTGPLVALNQEAAKLASDTTAQTNFQEKLKQIQAAYNSAKECSGTVIAQYGKLKKEEFPLFRS